MSLTLPSHRSHFIHSRAFELLNAAYKRSETYKKGYFISIYGNIKKV